MPSIRLNAKVGFSGLNLSITVERKPKPAQLGASKLIARNIKCLCHTSFFHSMLVANSGPCGAA
jgi:hypothetical protein